MLQKYLHQRSPEWEFDSFLDIDFTLFKGKFLLIDVDNTIARKGELSVTSEVRAALFMARGAGHIRGWCLVSNVVTRSQARAERIAGIAESLGRCPYVCARWPFIKPKKKPYLQALKLLKIGPDKAVMIGDQLLTDILGANKLGIETVLVKPLGKDGLVTKPRRAMEKVVLWLRAKSAIRPG